MKIFSIIENDMGIYWRPIGLHLDITRKYVNYEFYSQIVKSIRNRNSKTARKKCQVTWHLREFLLRRTADSPAGIL
jgi:hypothetical protein